MRRIYLEIYVSLVLSAVLVMIGGGVFGTWMLNRQIDSMQLELEQLGARIVAELPESGAAPGEIERMLEDAIAQSDGLRVRAFLRDADGDIVASATSTARDPGHRRFRGDREAFFRGPRAMPVWVSLDARDGTRLEITVIGPHPRSAAGRLGGLALFFGAIAIGAYPVSRRIARGLERLTAGVSNFADGDLEARVAIEGRNEVAKVGRAFNQAADKIEALVTTERRLLASASHELRSPLGRLRSAVELLAEGRTEHLAEAERNIEELDALVEDLLLTTRLQSAPSALTQDAFDLFEVASEEAQRFDARCEGAATPIEGNRRLIVRLIRNLLENADRYGHPPIEISVTPRTEGGGARVRVSDHGPGVPPSERERIFEAFYRPPGHSEGRHGGVGLGLALVAEVAEKHGGSARCLEREGGGTVFEVLLEG